jgi:single-strand DNA-binding protein
MTAYNKHIVSGRIGRKPEIRYTPSGVPVTSFSLARQPRRLNQQTNQWEDGELTWYDVTMFKRLAENVVNSLDQGHEVTVFGELKVSQYKTRDGEARQSLEIVADDVAVSLDHQIITVTDKSAYGNKAGGNIGGGGNNAPARNNSAPAYNAPAEDDDAPF